MLRGGGLSLIFSASFRGISTTRGDILTTPEISPARTICRTLPSVHPMMEAASAVETN
jgi:hypothetical protein